MTKEDVLKNIRFTEFTYVGKNFKELDHCFLCAAIIKTDKPFPKDMWVEPIIFKVTDEFLEKMNKLLNQS